MTSHNAGLLRVSLQLLLAPLLLCSSVNADANSNRNGGITTRDQYGSLHVHNWIRSRLNIDPLTWNDTLTQDAQSWANHLAQIDNMVHSPGSSRPNEGENLYMVWYSLGLVSYPLTRGSLAWLAEQPLYHNERIPNGDFEAYGHYTQMIWIDTTSVGIATANARSGRQYVVARYSPPGNIVGYRPF